MQAKTRTSYMCGGHKVIEHQYYAILLLLAFFVSSTLVWVQVEGIFICFFLNASLALWLLDTVCMRN